MKLPKKTKKKPSLPSQDETRRANVLREEMLSQFRVLGEGLSLLRDDVQSIKPAIAKIDKLETNMEILTSVVRTNGRDINTLREAVVGNTHDVALLKEAVQGNSDDVASLKEAVEDNSGVIDCLRTDLKHINSRLDTIESKVA